MEKTWDKQGGNFFSPIKGVDIVDQLSWLLACGQRDMDFCRSQLSLHWMAVGCLY